MDDRQLQAMQAAAIDNYFHANRYQIQSYFHPGRSLRNEISLRGKILTIRVSEHLRPAPPEILSIIAVILFAKLFRIRLSSSLNREYRNYIRQNILPRIPRRIRKPSAQYTAEGRYFNLDEIFDRLNLIWFQNKLPRPLIGWSLRKSYSRLGFYSYDKKLLVISRIFDARKVPVPVVEFLMYHEMLHIFLQPKEQNGRRQVHGPEFRRMEKQFPDHSDIHIWIRMFLNKQR